MLELKAGSFEGFYARAKAYLESDLFEMALADINSALEILSPHHSNTKNFLLLLHDNIVEKIHIQNQNSNSNLNQETN